MYLFIDSVSSSTDGLSLSSTMHTSVQHASNPPLVNDVMSTSMPAFGGGGNPKPAARPTPKPRSSVRNAMSSVPSDSVSASPRPTPRARKSSKPHNHTTGKFE